MTQTATTEAELLAQPADDYMNDAQQQFFRELLLTQRAELQVRIDEEFTELRQPDTSSDVADIGAAEEQRQWQLRLLEREKKLLDKIDQALERLARGEYGWCPGSAPRFGAATTKRGADPQSANPSASSACCCAPPRPCASKPRSARNSAKNISVTVTERGTLP